MKENVSAHEFWDRFAEGLREQLNSDPEWENKYKNSKTWTIFMFEFLRDFAKTKYTYSSIRECSTEYLRIDLGFFDNDNFVQFDNRKHHGFEWDFDVAIEHENDETAWFQEFVKLIHVNCGLKVLIAYHYHKNDINERLHALETIYNNRKYKNLNDQWLIILGPTLKDMKHNVDFMAFKSTINKTDETIKFTELSKKQILY